MRFFYGLYEYVRLLWVWDLFCGSCEYVRVSWDYCPITL